MKNLGEWEGAFLLVSPRIVPELASDPGRNPLTLHYLL